MKYASIVFAALALGTGLVAAWRWFESSRVQIDPGWGPPGSGRGFEPVSESGKAIGWTTATLDAFRKVSDLNRKAALWTAATVLLSTLSAVTGNWPT